MLLFIAVSLVGPRETTEPKLEKDVSPPRNRIPTPLVLLRWTALTGIRPRRRSEAFDVCRAPPEEERRPTAAVADAKRPSSKQRGSRRRVLNGEPWNFALSVPSKRLTSSLTYVSPPTLSRSSFLPFPSSDRPLGPTVGGALLRLARRARPPRRRRRLRRRALPPPRRRTSTHRRAPRRAATARRAPLRPGPRPDDLGVAKWWPEVDPPPRSRGSCATGFPGVRFDV